MKFFFVKLTIVSAFSILAFKGSSQNIIFADLKYLLEHDVESADTYITGKRFKYHDAQKRENGGCDAMIWSFDRNIDNDRAVSFIAKNCYEANSGFILYQLGDKAKFDRIKNYCKSTGFKRVQFKTSPSFPIFDIDFPPQS